VEPRRRFDLRFEGWALVELVALSGFAIAQPILDVFADAPEVFVFHRADGADIVAFTLLLVALPPLVLWTGGLLVGALAGQRVRRVVHHLTLAALAALLAIRVLREGTPLSGAILGAVAAALAVGAYLLVPRRGAQLWLRFASPAPVAFAVLFLFSSNISPLVTDSAGGLDAVADVEANGTPVVVLVFDELPTASLLTADGAIDAHRFPGFARLAADSTWFRNSTAVADYTERAVPAALTGAYPAMSPQRANWRDHPDNLFRLLGGAYDMHVTESLTVLCPPTVCDGEHDVPTPTADDADDTARSDGALTAVLREARDVYVDLVALDEPETSAVATFSEEVADVPTTTQTTLAPLPGDEVEPGINQELDPDARTRAQPRRVTDFLASLHEQPTDAPPGFWFLHVVLPHNPFHLLPNGQRYAIPTEAEAMPGMNGQLRWSDDPWPALAARQRHLLQLRAVDDALTQILDGLERLALYDRALVVATADHGASFAPRGQFRNLTDDNAHEIAWVPFIVKRPGNAGGGTVDDRNVEVIDLLPTIADVLDVDVPWTIDGRSAFGAPRPTSEKRFRSASLFQDPDAFEEHTFDGRAGLARMLASAPTIADDADFSLAILGSGPSGDLIGRRVDSFAPAPADDRRTAHIDRRDAFAAVDLDGELPAFVRGRLDGADGDEHVVIAVNGSIAGVSSVFGDRDERARFTLLVPPQLFRAGANDVAAYLMEELEESGGGRGIALAPLELG